MRVLLVTPDPQFNSLGRTYCLWLLARHLDWPVDLVTVAGHDKVWEPLRETEFGRSCRFLHLDQDAGRSEFARLLEACDVVLTVKPVPATLGAVYDLAVAAGRPVVADVDDPDVEVRTVWRPWHERASRRMFQRLYRQRLALGRLARRLPTLVSNPTLHDLYGGAIIPHVRHPMDVREHRATDAPVVRFIGSVKGHKGVDVLRAALERLAPEGYTMEVTADAPADAKPWETWLGRTTFDAGMELAATADIIAIPSLNEVWTPGQLPAKLIDAMMFGRPIVASDTPPIRWALDSTGLLVPPADVDALTAALRQLRGRDVRERLGLAAHQRALDMFSVQAVAPVFAAALAEALEAPEPGRVPGIRR